jgi:immunity protein 53 of polymorphic toxin system
MDVLTWIQEWFGSHCNGDWEHSEGIHVETLDNPGWAVAISLSGTDLEAKAFQKTVVERTDEDWFHCFVEGQIFKGYGGIRNLEEILQAFRKWAEHRDDASM